MPRALLIFLIEPAPSSLISRRMDSTLASSATALLMRPFLTRLSSESRTKAYGACESFFFDKLNDFVGALACVDEVMNHQREIGFARSRHFRCQRRGFSCRCFFQSKITSNHGGIVRAGELG